MTAKRLLAEHIAAKIFEAGTDTDGVKPERIAFMFGKKDRCGLAFDPLIERIETALHTFHGSDPTTPVVPARIEFTLLTGGNDHELDALHIVAELFRKLQGHEIARVLDYLQARYAAPVRT